MAPTHPPRPAAPPPPGRAATALSRSRRPSPRPPRREWRRPPRRALAPPRGRHSACRLGRAGRSAAGAPCRPLHHGVSTAPSTTFTPPPSPRHQSATSAARSAPAPTIPPRPAQDGVAAPSATSAAVQSHHSVSDALSRPPCRDERSSDDDAPKRHTHANARCVKRRACRRRRCGCCSPRLERARVETSRHRRRTGLRPPAHRRRSCSRCRRCYGHCSRRANRR